MPADDATSELARKALAYWMGRILDAVADEYMRRVLELRR